MMKHTFERKDLIPDYQLQHVVNIHILPVKEFPLKCDQKSQIIPADVYFQLRISVAYMYIKKIATMSS